MNPETKKKLSESLKRKWASGTRKANPPESRNKQARTLSKSWKEGRVKPRDPTELKRTLERATQNAWDKNGDLFRAHLKKLADEQKGIPKTGPLAAGEDNINSKYWAFQHLDGTIIRGKNLRCLIHENSGCFNPEDVKGGLRSRAYKGLGSVYRGEYSTWKGWTPL